ncbi:GNAT family N-acetyltransferase [Cryobacterium arcticum]|uniref:N-acetyltransferase n=1 Tax=Cryobacterium arcticum TaxID=670052 RepID=A0A317ZXR5_9MICO|nr:GNAT family N-acetyltransferase [Cryobacterium arcticum]PXA70082.1 N-acetyltransferase [Cryobacterium arcticum]
MRPVELSSPLLRLDQPRPEDADLVFEYCQDPLFKGYLAAMPWPYRPEDATGFISGHVPSGWADDNEYTWALRAPVAPAAVPGVPGATRSPLLGVISLSLPPRRAAGTGARTGSIGFWLGAPHRGQGLMVEAERLVLDWAFAGGLLDAVHWECVAGNLGSARAARKAGFSFTTEAPARPAYRDGSHPMSWHGILHAADDRTPRPGWPAAVTAA